MRNDKEIAQQNAIICLNVQRYDENHSNKWKYTKEDSEIPFITNI